MLVDSGEGWVFVWPARGEEPDRSEAQLLRDSNRGMWATDRVNIVSPWSFSYPNRLRKDDDG